ncbi:type I restriction endonuclease, partial [Escherichia coli]|nr:type I restriction endonuclease [Escherichia coli]
NPHLPTDVFEQVISRITRAESPDLIASNKAFHHWLLEGVPVQYRRDEELIHDHALLVDFSQPQNNRFMVVNQMTISGTKQPRRPDIICFINGIPLAVVELKSPVDDKVDIWDAYHQLQTYKDEIRDLFISNEALIVSDGY